MIELAESDDLGGRDTQSLCNSAGLSFKGLRKSSHQSGDPIALDVFDPHTRMLLATVVGEPSDLRHFRLGHRKVFHAAHQAIPARGYARAVPLGQNTSPNVRLSGPSRNSRHGDTPSGHSGSLIIGAE